MSTIELYALPKNKDGWTILPNGNCVKLGNRVTLGNGVTLGDGVTLGNGVRLGNGVTWTTTPCQVMCHPYLVYPHSLTEIGVGCVIHPLTYWLREQDPDELAEYPECRPWANYRAAIGLVVEWLKTYEPAVKP